jgi:hypothetical protein
MNMYIRVHVGTLCSTVSQQSTIQFGTKPINERFTWPQMGMFAETVNVDYRLSFADQGKQTSVFRSPLVPFSIYILKGLHIYTLYIYT